MITTVLMGACIVIGLIIAIPPLLEMDFAKKIFARKQVPTPVPTPVVVDSVVVTVPPVIIPEPIAPPVQVPVKPSRSKLAHIVQEWENFVDVLVENGMEESAEDMKSLLNKMVNEYRNDLNENDDTNPGVASIDSIIAPAPEKVE